MADPEMAVFIRDGAPQGYGELSCWPRQAARRQIPSMTTEGMVHSQCDSLVKAQTSSIVMPDLIGHLGVRIRV